jgi:nucleoside-diphosphate-sugar epimerase
MSKVPGLTAEDPESALVTGATGFLGRHLVQALLDRRVKVRALVRSPDRARGLAEQGVEIVSGDITDRDTLVPAVRPVDTVFHCAALVRPEHLPLERYRAVNVEGTRNLLEACRAHANLRRLVHVSTVAVLGPVPPGQVYAEEVEPRPTDRYGITKLEAEGVVWEATRAGLPVVVARPEWIYGPHSGSTHKLFRRIASRRFLLVGPARNRHQPLWFGDVVDGLLKCAEVPGVEGQVFHLAGPEVLTVERQCRLVADAVGTPLPRWRVPMWLVLAALHLGEALFSTWGGRPPIRRRHVDFFRLNRAYSIKKAQAALGWQPKVAFEEGVRLTATWLVENGMLRAAGQ